jgi:hypothetical protein
VVIPDSVTSLGSYVFKYCTNLTSVVIGKGVTSIGESAFQYCTSLTRAVIPDSVTSLSTNAFNYCTNLTSVVIGKGVTSIGQYAFYSCNNLFSVMMYPTVPPAIQSSTFSGNPTFIVPEGYGEVYKSATNWSKWASAIVAVYDNEGTNVTLRVVYGGATNGRQGSFSLTGGATWHTFIMGDTVFQTIPNGIMFKSSSMSYTFGVTNGSEMICVVSGSTSDVYYPKDNETLTVTVA